MRALIFKWPAKTCSEHVGHATMSAMPFYSSLLRLFSIFLRLSIMCELATRRTELERDLSPLKGETNRSNLLSRVVGYVEWSALLFIFISCELLLFRVHCSS